MVNIQNDNGDFPSIPGSSPPQYCAPGLKLPQDDKRPDAGGELTVESTSDKPAIEEVSPANKAGPAPTKANSAPKNKGSKKANKAKRERRALKKENKLLRRQNRILAEELAKSKRAESRSRTRLARFKKKASAPLIQAGWLQLNSNGQGQGDTHTAV